MSKASPVMPWVRPPGREDCPLAEEEEPPKPRAQSCARIVRSAGAGTGGLIGGTNLLVHLPVRLLALARAVAGRLALRIQLELAGSIGFRLAMSTRIWHSSGWSVKETNSCDSGNGGKGPVLLC